MKCDPAFTPVVTASSSNDNSNIYINTSFGFFFLKVYIKTIGIVIQAYFLFINIKKKTLINVYTLLTTDADTYFEKEQKKKKIYISIKIIEICFGCQSKKGTKQSHIFISI